MIAIDPQGIAQAIDLHRSNPDISLDAHVKARTLQLGQSLVGRKKVYLDKRYWIILRDAELGKAGHPRTRPFLEMLRSAVESGACICPISESVFLELLKQQDRTTRRQTAQLIDELSQGVTLVPMHQRIAQELVGVLATCVAEGIYAIDELVWSRLSYILGVVHPTNTGLPESEELPVQKAFFDFVWELPLVDAIDCLSEAEAPPSDFDGLAGRINEGNRRHSGEGRSFRQLYLDEFRGGLSLYVHIPRMYLQEAYERHTGSKHSNSEEEDSAHEHELLTFFGNLVTRKDVPVMLPTLQIDALCHAAVRWDRTRKVKGNDFYDFQHASAAVAYCDAFMTEKPLKTLLQQRHLGLQENFRCDVISAVDDAERWLIENAPY